MKKKTTNYVLALRITKGLFFVGVGLLILSYLLLQVGVDIVPAVSVTIIAFLAIIVGVLYGMLCLRCPYCKKSLMEDGKLPKHIPPYCAECGKPLDETASE